MARHAVYTRARRQPREVQRESKGSMLSQRLHPSQSRRPYRLRGAQSRELGFCPENRHNAVRNADHAIDNIDPLSHTSCVVVASVLAPDWYMTAYAEHKALVFSRALQLTKNRSEAEDLTHEVFLEALRKNDYDSARGSVISYLLIKTERKAI